MICKNCSAENVDDAVFCCKCGSKIVIEQSKKICTQCGSELNEDDCFCTKCGTKVDLPSNDTAEEKKDFSVQSSSRFPFGLFILALPIVAFIFVCFFINFPSQFEKTLSAAEKGDAEAQFNLGVMYASGEGVEKDDYEAVKWYRKAAEQGYADAQFNLGHSYLNGRGVVTHDNEKAVTWYRKAAEQGHARAQLLLGICYNHGFGVTKMIIWR